MLQLPQNLTIAGKLKFNPMWRRKNPVGQASGKMHYSYVVPYYENPGMLEINLKAWCEYPEGWDFIVVDDGSQKAPAREVILASGNRPPSLKLYRVKEDIPWNAHGARNLAAHVARFGWMFMTDIDTILFKDQARQIMEMQLDLNRYYRFPVRRVNDNSEIRKYGPNLFLVQRYLFWAAGGYDEDFCNESYGGDRQLLDTLDRIGKKYVVLENVPIYAHPEEHFPGSSVTKWAKRGGPFHDEYLARLHTKTRMKWTRALTPLRFDWERQL